MILDLVCITTINEKSKDAAHGPFVICFLSATTSEARSLSMDLSHLYYYYYCYNYFSWHYCSSRPHDIRNSFLPRLSNLLLANAAFVARQMVPCSVCLHVLKTALRSY